ncbi:GNAT family N-acetyltransferase [Paraconexibacter antarcticus]|uniref:GNAT family N-acetyltransferase n=1 Tax=Paraconexibacter antarcticus TaxID=2949664 RepID=A0ABY5DTJ6_9ACTN|nr:GNAT family N-acetyltransferase [Paraconexibacter antarcticus]UTI64291.1 GNAT family N-acetyltransferase [Paraconexibacter antarcticus]
MSTAMPQAPVKVSEVTTASEEIASALGMLARRLPRYSQTPTVADVQRIVDNPSTRLIIARDDDEEIVGMMTVALYSLPTGVRAWLEDVAVARSGRGIGRALTEEALRIAREGGAADAELIVQPSQTGGLKMASLMGFGPNDEDTRRIRL